MILLKHNCLNWNREVKVENEIFVSVLCEIVFKYIQCSQIEFQIHEFKFQRDKF